MAIEIFKTLHNLNPAYMKDIFTRNENTYNLRNNSRHENDLLPQRYNAFTYGECSLRILGPNVWNSLPIDMKNAQSLQVFKNLINTWDGPTCNCKICIYFNK